MPLASLKYDAFAVALVSDSACAAGARAAGAMARASSAATRHVARMSRPLRIIAPQRAAGVNITNMQRISLLGQERTNCEPAAHSLSAPRDLPLATPQEEKRHPSIG